MDKTDEMRDKCNAILGWCAPLDVDVTEDMLNGVMAAVAYNDAPMFAQIEIRENIEYQMRKGA